METKTFATVFFTVLLAELGDKTQLATFLYAADAKHSKWVVFAAAALALVLTSALGVALGATISRYLSEKVLTWLAGLGFIAVGLWTIVKG